jgi:ATP-dependent DNA helicase RecG
MSYYTDTQLEALLDDLESDKAERKESWSGDSPTKGRQAICAFANDLPNHNEPGVLIVGAKDNGTPSGLAISDKLLMTLSDIKTDGRIVPPPTLTVEKRRFRDQPFDARPCRSAEIGNLDLTWYAENYLPAAIAPEVLEANERSIEQRLASTRMILSPDDPTPTHLAVLTLTSQPRDFLPGCYVQFLQVAGLTLADQPTDAAEFEGRLADVIRRVEEKLDSHNRTAVDFTSGTLERRRQLYPMVALQQLFRNAVMHRTYEHTNSPIRITWYADRIEMISPGGPVGMVTRDNFGTPGFTDYRNPNLAGFLREMGFAQRFGAGIATARRECEINGNPPPEFDVQAAFIRATLRPAIKGEA